MSGSGARLAFAARMALSVCAVPGMVLALGVAGCPGPKPSNSPATGSLIPDATPDPSRGLGQGSPPPELVTVAGTVSASDGKGALYTELASLAELPAGPLSLLAQAPFRRLKDSAIEAIRSAEPLTDVVPLAATQPLRVLALWLQAEPETGVVVEAVDLASATALARARTDRAGRYSLQVPRGAARALVIQAGAISHSHVTAYLAAPVTVGLADTSPVVANVAPGSTTVALSLALLAGVREQFDTYRGFRGFKSPELANLVALQNPQGVSVAARAIDEKGGLLRGGSALAVLSLSARNSGVMAREAVRAAEQVGARLDTVAASQRLILSGLPAALAEKPDLSEAIVSAAQSVTSEAVTKEADAVRTQAAVRAEDLAIDYGEALRSGYLGHDWHPPRITSLRILAGPGGAGEPGYADGPAASARFSSPTAVAVEPDGGVYVADSGNRRIRKILPDGTVKTLAGDGQRRILDGAGSGASFHSPFALALDPDGSLLVAENQNSYLRRMTSDGTVATVLGTAGQGDRDGEPGEAQLSNPGGLAVDLDGMIYVADTGNNRIRR